MKSLGRYAWGLVVVASSAASADAQHHFAQSYKAAYQQNAMWPTQYVEQPRQTICQTFDLMVQSGWRRQNLLGSYHFQPGSAELSEAGELKLRWILTQTPPARRNVFVERGATSEETADRVAAVERHIAKMSHLESAGTVSDTNLVEYGRSAQTVDAVFTGFSANQPAPVLPQNTGGGGGEN